MARGVRQGCVLSPELFSLYTEIELRKINHMDGIKLGGLNVNDNIGCEDDTAIVAESEGQLQTLIHVIA